METIVELYVIVYSCIVKHYRAVFRKILIEPDEIRLGRLNDSYLPYQYRAILLLLFFSQLFCNRIEVGKHVVGTVDSFFSIESEKERSSATFLFKPSS